MLHLEKSPQHQAESGFTNFYANLKFNLTTSPYKYTNMKYALLIQNIYIFCFSLVAYMEENSGGDHFVKPVRPRDNPFEEKSGCAVL